ncbi:MAG TPA: nucleotidyltransferase domain-containing protein [Ideonella sp.]|uniref:nucleotidyltransferase domain-containing protein n=1 Tax=Ideonella sp. TaxID=1929293 RepID=UPI002BC952DA|nr:nucleotidyltransferase domain-containing protein [Ideonella sp.]HSI50305.1 nucleotidyltransferase domain-containing protein [Ideonella sp.]
MPLPLPDDAHPIDPLIRQQIMAKLAAVEVEHGVRVLYACESGSRGWGFASPDSDYDVRFVYARPARDYLQLAQPRDVIEEVPGPVFDVNGWDLRKALQLLAKGNATLVEWLSSPVVYRQDDVFVQRLREAATAVYQPVRSFHHYHAMARGNYREYLHGDQVRAKKYLYVLRPLLAAQWVLTHEDAPPMAFESLVGALVDDAAVRNDIAELLMLKRQAGEQDWLQARPVLNAFMDRVLASMAELQPALVQRSLAPLDALLADTLLGA